MKRREFLTLPAQTLGGVMFYSLAGRPSRLIAQDNQIRVPLRFFTAAEARIVQAACDRIFPSDAAGPGATEAGVVIFIDRQLAGPYGKDKYRYTKAPFQESFTEHGYQGKETPREIYRAGIAKLGDRFAELSASDRDQTLRAIEKTSFFRLLRQHTIEGMFSDPLHGGNVDMIGWQLIGYPGPRMNYRDHIDKHFGEEYHSKPASLAQIVGHAVKGWEEEMD